jgi:hypothetical protein
VGSPSDLLGDDCVCGWAREIRASFELVNAGDGHCEAAEFVDALGISDVDGVRQGVPGISNVGEIGDIGDGSGGGINVSGGGNINDSAGSSSSLSGVVASARVSLIVRVITEGDLSDLGPISTSPPCSIRVCIADELRCDPKDDKAPLPLPAGEVVLDFCDAVSMIS